MAQLNCYHDVCNKNEIYKSHIDSVIILSMLLCEVDYVNTYVIFLPLQFLAEVELLGLQLHHPLPELIGLLSARTNQKLRQWPFTRTVMRPCSAVTYFSLSSDR